MSCRQSVGFRIVRRQRERGSRSWKGDALEGEDLGEPVEVRVTMEYGEAAVLGCGRGDQRVGEWHAVVTVPVAGQLTIGAHGCVGDGAIVAQDA